MIKYRFWDNREKRYVTSEDSGSSAWPSLLAIGLHGLPIAIDPDSFKKDGEIVGWNIDHYIDIEVHLGWVDKNDIELYAGDIVKFIDEEFTDDQLMSDDVNAMDTWTWVERNRDVVVTDRTPAFWLKNEKFGFEGEELQYPMRYEKIGTIRENPELLDMKDDDRIHK